MTRALGIALNQRVRCGLLAAGTLALLLTSAGGHAALAQIPIGSVATEDAIVAGSTATDNSRSVLIGNVTVTAKDHAAYVQLFRGGTVKVCATSGVHLTSGNLTTASTVAAGKDVRATGELADGPAVASPTPQFPMMVSLDRGAAELRLNALASDVLMTPDLRFAFSEDGPLDLRVRVGGNGDTCVENRVAGLSRHPTLQIGSLFGNDNYNVLPGQHVLFEHGNLHEVVDNESSPCGCPDEPVKTIQATPDISLFPGTRVPTPPPATQMYPFPAAVSQGLAPPPPVPQAEPGAVHTQVSEALVFKGEAPPPSAPNEVPKVAEKVPEKLPAAEKPGVFRSIGRFFKRIFS